jgi:NAD(P)-dependent dehydrogenase (short-subunit alcohol dehydrogenase family)
MLAGRTIVVTGAARGVGRAIARACAKAGARLVLGDILENDGRAAAEELTKAGASVRFLPIDLNDPSSIQTFARDVAQREGHIHGLVNNAAIATNVGGKAFDEIDLDLWDRVMRVNVRGTWLVTRALAPLFADGGHGRIVNVASDTALWGAPRLLAYVASKGAVIAMTRTLARELGADGITVNTIMPGLTYTEVPNQAAVGDKVIPMQCIPRREVPEDLVPAVLFLASEGSRFMTGQTVNVDGGCVHV